MIASRYRLHQSLLLTSLSFSSTTSSPLVHPFVSSRVIERHLIVRPIAHITEHPMSLAPGFLFGMDSLFPYVEKFFDALRGPDPPICSIEWVNAATVISDASDIGIDPVYIDTYGISMGENNLKASNNITITGTTATKTIEATTIESANEAVSPIQNIVAAFSETTLAAVDNVEVVVVNGVIDTTVHEGKAVVDPIDVAPVIYG